MGQQCLKLRGRKPVFTKEMKETVISLLEEGYSPEQITGRSNVEGFAMVSHETMYRWIWEDKRKKGTLYQNLLGKGRNTTNVETLLREGDTSPIVWI